MSWDPRYLIKGRIAEEIFENMFHETKKFTIQRFGYESILPMLSQFRQSAEHTKVVEQVSKNPDFVLMTDDKKQVYFVEVKYRAHFTDKNLLEIANELLRRWEFCFLFVISPQGFYFSPIHKIINNGGGIEPLSTNWVPKKIQDEYLKIVKEFIPIEK